MNSSPPLAGLYISSEMTTGPTLGPLLPLPKVWDRSATNSTVPCEFR